MITKLSVVGLLFSLATGGYISGADAANRPDVEKLYAEYAGHQKLDSRPTVIKTQFAEGVAKAISEIENKKTVRLSFYGLSSAVELPDPDLGVPSSSKGCIVKFDDEAKLRGEYMALLYYASQGIYPVNSIKARMPVKVPPNVKWAAFTNITVPNHPGLKMHLEGTPRAPVHISIANPEMSTIRIGDGPVPAPIEWAYDQPNDSVWFKLKQYSEQPLQIIHLEESWEIPRIYYTPLPRLKLLTWSPLKDAAAADKSAANFLSTVKKTANYGGSNVEELYMIFKHNGKNTDYKWPWPRSDDFWNAASWAYEEKSQSFWIELHRKAEVLTEFVQVDCKSGYEVQRLHPDSDSASDKSISNVSPLSGK